MNKILLISEVASLGRDFEKYVTSHNGKSLRALPSPSVFGLNSDRRDTLLDSVEDESSAGGMTYNRSDFVGEDIDRIIDPDDRHPLTGSLSSQQKARIGQLLGMWEEPTIAEKTMVSAIEAGFRTACCAFTNEYAFRRGSRSIPCSNFDVHLHACIPHSLSLAHLDWRIRARTPLNRPKRCTIA